MRELSVSEERRASPERRSQEDRRMYDDWLYFGPEGRKQATDRRVGEDDRRED